MLLLLLLPSGLGINWQGLFEQVNHGAYSNPGGAPQYEFWGCYADEFNQSLVSSMAQARVRTYGRTDDFPTTLIYLGCVDNQILCTSHFATKELILPNLNFTTQLVHLEVISVHAVRQWITGNPLIITWSSLSRYFSQCNDTSKIYLKPWAWIR